MWPLLSLSTELTVHIFQSCDSFLQATSLSATCKHLHAVWRENSPSVIWRVGMAEIPAFHDALIAARATKIVLDHFSTAQLPPDPFPFHLLSGRLVKPTLEELRSVVNFHHLTKCLEKIFLTSTEWDTVNVDTQPDPTAAWRKWREGFHRAMYRVFLAGAALCRAYQEPLNREDPDRPAQFLEYQRARGPARSRLSRPTISDREIAYLMQYPVFNFEAYERHESVYGPLAEFLAQEARLEAKRHGPTHLVQLLPREANPTRTLLDDSEASTLFVQTIQSLFAFLLFDGYKSDINMFDSDEPGADDDTYAAFNPVTFILLGRFFPEEVLMPTDIDDAELSFLVRRRVVSPGEAGDRLSGSCPVMYWPVLRRVLAAMKSRSGQPNYHGMDNRTPDPPLQFIQYIARRYLGLRFARDAFYDGFPSKASRFSRDGDIFLEDAGTWPETAACMFDTVDKDYTAWFDGSV